MMGTRDVVPRGMSFEGREDVANGCSWGSMGPSMWRMESCSDMVEWLANVVLWWGRQVVGCLENGDWW